MKEDVTKNCYGMISASRITSNNTYLFGSDIPHSTFITLRIHNAEVDEKYSTNHDIFPKERLIEIRMSASQWADLLCNMNTMGVPCTVTRVLNEKMEEYSPIQDRINKTFRKGKEYLENASTRGLLNRVRNLISDLKIPKKQKEELEVATRNLDKDLKSNATFYLEEFIKEAEKVVQESKAEIEANRAYITEQLGFIKLDEIKKLNDGK